MRSSATCTWSISIRSPVGGETHREDRDGEGALSVAREFLTTIPWGLRPRCRCDRRRNRGGQVCLRDFGLVCLLGGRES